MTAVLPDPPAPAAGPSADRPSPPAVRSLPLLLAAAGVVVVVVGLVLVLGVHRPPALPSLADAPEPAPPGAVAWTEWEGGRNCVHTARPDGSTQVLHCSRDGGEIVGFVDDGIILRTWEHQGHTLQRVDATSGEIVERRTAGGEPDHEHDPRSFDPIVDGEPFRGAHVRTTWLDGRLDVEVAGRVVWQVEVSDAYDLTTGVLAPDGSAALAIDTAGRLLLLPADPGIEPRVWVQDIGRWRVPVWQGTPAPAWEAAGDPA